MAKNYMFAEFKDANEYQNAYRSVMAKMPNNYQFELVVFIERLRSTMLTEQENKKGQNNE